MIIAYSLVSLFIAWIWVDYYRLIDIYEKEKLKYFVITFFLGAASVLLVIGLQRFILDEHGLYLNGEWLNDLAYAFLQVGAVEELAKLIPFLLVYYLFRKQFNEPIDYIAYICTAALGFSAVENTLNFYYQGAEIINFRAIFSSVSHMIHAALVGYGIVLYKFRQGKWGPYIVVVYFLFAVLSHGFHDFWIFYNRFLPGSLMVSISYSLILISFFAVIVNNSLNNSSFFTYRKSINSKKVANRLFTYYSIVFGLQILFISVEADLKYALFNFQFALSSYGLIVMITIIRLSRFKLLQNHWEKLSFKLPFTYGFGLKVRGDSFNEALLSKYYQDYFELRPVSKRNSHLKKTSLAFLEKKIYLWNEYVCYKVKVFEDGKDSDYQTFLLRPKLNGTNKSRSGDPIVAVYRVKDFNSDFNSKSDLDFLEWGVVQPLPQQEEVVVQLA